MIISAELNREELENRVLGNNSTTAILESLLWTGKSLTKVGVKKFGVAYLKIWLESNEEKRYAPIIHAEAKGVIEFNHEETLYEEDILSEAYHRALKDAVDSIIEDFVDELSGAMTSWIMFEHELNKQSKKRKWYKFWRW